MNARTKLIRIGPYVERELRTRLTKHCVMTSSTESRVVNEALHRLLDNTDEGLLAKRLEAMSKQLLMVEYSLQEAKHALNVLMEVVPTWMRLWCRKTALAKYADEKKAVESAQRHYAEFAHHVRTRMVGGQRFVDELGLPADMGMPDRKTATAR